MATRKDVAKLAGVSVATVSNVLGKRLTVSDEKANRVLEAARKLNYIPNHTARCLSSGRSNHIGVIVNEFTNPYHMEIVQFIGKYVMKNGFMMTVLDFQEESKNINKMLGEWQFDALINFSSNIYSERLLSNLRSRGIVLVNFANVSDMEVHHDVSDAMLRCMKRLQELGHTRVGYVSTLDSLRWIDDERGKVFTEERANCGFSLNEDYVVYNDDYTKSSIQIGYDGCKTLFAKNKDITAIFATNDMAVMGAVRALKEMGYDCPKDVSVVGCDDILFSRNCVPSLTTIGFDKEEYGTEIAKRVLDKLQNGAEYSERYCIQAKAMFRESIDIARK